MKKEAILFLFLLTFTIVIAQPDLILQSTEIQPYEIMIGEIPASNFVTILKESDIKFYQDNRPVFFEHELFFYNNTYYFSALMTKQGNYTLRISDILYQDPSPQTTSIEKKIQVREIKDENNQTKILSIKPGIIFTSKAENLTLSNKGTISLDVTYRWFAPEEDSGFFSFLSPETISITPGNFERILIKPNKPFEYFVISTYKEFKIPVIYFSIQPPMQAKLKAEPESIQIKINEDNSTLQLIELFNFGGNITSINITTNLSIIKIESQINKIDEKTKTNFTLKILPEKPGTFIGEIIINFTSIENYLLTIPVEISVFSKNIIIEELKTCSELNGIFCNQNQTCSEITESYDSPECCIGECTEKEKEKSSYSWLIGLALLITFFLILYLIYKKLKKTKPKSPEEKIEERTKLYEQRVSGSLTKE